MAAMAQDGAKVETRSSPPWSDEELAILINYMDWCLKHDQSYKSGIMKALNYTKSTRRSLNAINKKLKSCLVYKCEKMSIKDFTQQGTACLSLNSMLPRIVSEMASQRKRLGLDALGVTDALPTAITGDSTTSLPDDSESVSTSVANIVLY
jgi:hypothetical protein